MGISRFYQADYSLNVARLANLPGEVIAVAAEKSRTMEEETKKRELQRW
jgi:DNA mismatch repair ATPase MutS